MLHYRRLWLIVFILSLHNSSFAKMQYSIGYTGAWLNTNRSIAGGFAFSASRNIFEIQNASLSVSTHLKLGLEDKSGAFLIIPAFIAVDAQTGYKSNKPDASFMNHLSGGTIHVFADIPLLLHYNLGLGSRRDSERRFGFYLGGGVTYVATGYTDTLGYSKRTGFAGWVADGGVRFRKNIDINIANVFAFRKPIGPVKYPVFSEVTLSFMF